MKLCSWGQQTTKQQNQSLKNRVQHSIVESKQNTHISLELTHPTDLSLCNGEYAAYGGSSMQGEFSPSGGVTENLLRFELGLVS